MRCRDQPQTKQRDRVDVGPVFDRRPFVHCAPNQIRFLPFNGEQIAHHFGFALLSRFVRRCGSVIGFAVDFCIDRRSIGNAGGARSTPPAPDQGPTRISRGSCRFARNEAREMSGSAFAYRLVEIGLKAKK